MQFFKLHGKHRNIARIPNLKAVHIIIAVAAGASFGPQVMAAKEICPIDTLSWSPLDPKYAGMNPAKLPIEIEADRAELIKDGLAVFTGRAEIVQGRKSIFADEIRYSKKTGVAVAKGNVVLRTEGGDEVRTSFLSYKVETGIGHTESAEYQLADSSRKTGDPNKIAAKGRGKAKRINFEGHDLLRLEGASYTTCAKGQDDVWIYARELRLDGSIGLATAKGMQVRFKDVPIFYAPRMVFPITNERKSGFLTPSFGGESGSGLGFALPYYWNIAPNMDATFSPRIMANRGLMLDGEFRYLQKDYSGTVRGTFLPNDNEYKGSNDTRGAFSYRHNQKLGNGWTADVNYQWASDEDYFDDFSDKLGISSRTHLPQQVFARYRGKQWNLTGSLEAYQTIDKTLPQSSRPHERLPKVVFSTNIPHRPGGLKYGLQGEFVNFRHSTRVAGTRLDLTPSVSWPLTKAYGFFEPKLAIRHTSYMGLENVAAGSDTNQSRTVGVFSVNGGLFFERDITWGGRPFIQTLEPRLFYVYAPKVDQNNLPNFDTGVLSLNNFGNFFRDNRFTGADRVEDANRVTMALTSRWQDAKTGKERIRASIGQIYYFDDREVTLSGVPETASTSDLIGEISARIARDWLTQALVQWDAEDDEPVYSRVDLQYQPAADRRLSLGYRYTRDSREQADLLVAWPLAQRWYLRGRYLHSIRDNKALETYVGLEYDACCWALRVGGQRRVDNNQNYRNSVMIEVELTGLTKVGTGFGRRL